MHVSNHALGGIAQRGPSSNLTGGQRGRIVPRFIVLHYTCGWSAAGSIAHLLGAAGGSTNAASSAHLVIDRDGTTTQLAPFNRRAWHAGRSRWREVGDLNSHAVGIEFQNPGWLRPDGHGGWIDYFNHRRSSSDLEAFGGYLVAPHPRVGAGEFAWPLFPAAQLEAGLEACRALVAHYPIQAVLTHEEIDLNGGKTDPGPAFPVAVFRELVGDADGTPAAAGERVVGATRLNLRGGPGTGFERMEPPGHLVRGTRVGIRRRDGDWAYVEVLDTPAGGDRLFGWVHADYLEDAPPA